MDSVPVCRPLPLRRCTALLFFLGFLIIGNKANAWEIASFETQAVVNGDSTASITETIVADFGGEPRHGIYRDIPIHYTDRAGQHFRLRIRLTDVSTTYRIENAGRYLRIRLGDPQATVSGRQSYRLAYAVDRGAVRFFPDHDEFYWNLTGNEWAVPIRQIRATVSLPPAAKGIRAIAFVGAYGSTDVLQEVTLSGTQISFEPPRGFNAYEGLTAVVAWNKAAVNPPTVIQVLGWWLQDNWSYGIPLGLLVFMIWLWAKRGRDPRTNRSIQVEYAPPENLSPAEMGALVDERADLRDITATVIDLAVRGYLKIEPKPSGLFGATGYTFHAMRPWKQDGSLKPHEQKLLEGIFGEARTQRDLSELKYAFSDELADARQNIYASLVGQGYFDAAPSTVRSAYYFFGGIFGIVCYLLLSTLSAWRAGALASLVIAALSGGIIIAFGYFMPRRTWKGAQVMGRVLGFVEFLKRTDADRIKRMDDPGLFERCLAYALAFGVAQQWARAFEGIYTTPPGWYSGRWDNFSVYRLTHDLDHAMSSMGQSFSAAPRSSGSSGSWGGSGFGGGGFSGGGGGGGGGGAW